MARGFKTNPKRRVESDILPGQKEPVTTESPRIVMGKQMEQTETHITIVEQIVHSHTHKRQDVTDLFSTPFWPNIPDKPTTYPPSAHTHTKSDITDFAHTHLRSDITNFSHASTHQHGGNDEIATATPAPNAIPKAGADGKLALGWIPSGVDAGRLQGRNVASTAPSHGQVLRWNANANQWEPGTVTGGGQLGICATIPPTSIAPGAHVTVARFFVPIMLPKIHILAIAVGPSEFTYEVVTLALRNDATGQIIASWVGAGAIYYAEPNQIYDLSGYEELPVSFILYHSSSEFSLTCWASVFFKFTS